jgi:hypothetical protein
MLDYIGEGWGFAIMGVMIFASSLIILYFIFLNKGKKISNKRMLVTISICLVISLLIFLVNQGIFVLWFIAFSQIFTFISLIITGYKLFIFPSKKNTI